MDSARSGNKKANESFEKLGINIKNSDGSLRNSKDVWAEAIDALGKIGNETERDAVAMSLFGKSAQELNPLIVAGGDSLKKYGDEAEKLGIIMGEDQVAALGRFDDAMQQLQGSLEGAKNKVAVALLPALEKMIPVIQEQLVPAIAKFAEKIATLIQKFLDLSPETQGFILKLGAVVVAAGPVLSVLGTVTGIMASLTLKTALTTSAVGALSAGTTSLGVGLAAALGPAGTIMLAVAGLGLLVLALKEAIPYAEKLKNEGTLAGQALSAGSKNGFVRNSYNGPAMKNTQTTASSFDAKMAAKSGKLESYAIGTNYVPSDGLAYLHKGEAVIPADKNKGFTGGIVINVTGNNIMSDRDADVLGDRLVRRLKLAGVKV